MRPRRSSDAIPLKKLHKPLIVFFLLTIPVAGQSSPSPSAPSTTAPATPAFEAVDVHVSAPDTEPSGRFLPDGRVEFNATTMFALIKFAWNIEEDRISGGPLWLDTDRFDIIAKPARRVPEGVQRRMLQALLVERFGLAVHTENKPMPVFVLSAGNRNLLQQSSNLEEPKCEPNRAGEGTISITCRNMTMAGLAEFLRGYASAWITHPMVDKTGLTGAWDFTLKWTPRGTLLTSGGVSLFDAIDKQIGLRIAEGNAPMPVLMVDRVNRMPTANQPNISSVLPPPPKEFEVAEVKPSKPGTPQGGRGFMPSGRVELVAFPLRDLIAIAWNVDLPMVVTGQKWLESERFDIVATGSSTGSSEAIRKMLQALLVDRFKVAVHREDQPVPVFALEQARRGSKLKEARGDGFSRCKLDSGDNLRTFACTNTTMTQFAEKLRPAASSSLNHPVVDLTGLKGVYDFVLSWTPAAAPGSLTTPPDGTPPGQLAADTPSDNITLFEAADRQLGLKISEQKHPMPVVVVDHAERTPTDN